MYVSVFLKVEDGRLNVEVNVSDNDGNYNFDSDCIDLDYLAEMIDKHRSKETNQ